MNSQTRLLLMLPVLAIAAWLALFGDKTPVDEPAALPLARPAPIEAAPEASAAGAAVPAPVEDDVPPGQVRRLASRADMLAKGDALNDLFGSTGAAAAPPPPPPEAPPPPPEQPFVLIGRMLDGGRWQVFLERNGFSYVLGAGAEADGFRIDAVSEREVRLTRKADKAGFVIPIDGEKKD